VRLQRAWCHDHKVRPDPEHRLLRPGRNSPAQRLCVPASWNKMGRRRGLDYLRSRPMPFVRIGGGGETKPDPERVRRQRRRPGRMRRPEKAFEAIRGTQEGLHLGPPTDGPEIAAALPGERW